MTTSMREIGIGVLGSKSQTKRPRSSLIPLWEFETIVDIHAGAVRSYFAYRRGVKSQQR